MGFRCVHVRGSGAVTQSPNAKIPGSIRILGGDALFLAPVSFRGLPACPCKVVGRPDQCPEAGVPGEIRIFGMGGVSVASVGFRGLPRSDFGNSESVHLGGIS